MIFDFSTNIWMILLDFQQGFAYSSAFDPVEAGDGAG